MFREKRKLRSAWKMLCWKIVGALAQPQAVWGAHPARPLPRFPEAEHMFGQWLFSCFGLYLDDSLTSRHARVSSRCHFARAAAGVRNAN